MLGEHECLVGLDTFLHRCSLRLSLLLTMTLSSQLASLSLRWNAEYRDLDKENFRCQLFKYMDRVLISGVNLDSIISQLLSNSKMMFNRTCLVVYVWDVMDINAKEHLGWYQTLGDAFLESSQY